MISLLFLQACLPSLSGQWSPPVTEATGDTGVISTDKEPRPPREPPEFSLEGEAITAWTGSDVEDQLGYSLDVYDDGQYAAVLAAHAVSPPGEIFLISLPDDVLLGNLSESIGHLIGEEQWCPGITEIEAIESGDGLEAIALGCYLYDNPNLGGSDEGSAYLLPADEITGEVAQSALINTILWYGYGNDQWFGAALASGHLFDPSDEDGIEDLVVGAPADGNGSILQGSVYILPVEGLTPGDHFVEDEGDIIVEITGSGTQNDGLGRDLDVGVNADGDSQIAVTAPGLAQPMAFVIDGPFSPGDTLDINDAKSAFPFDIDNRTTIHLEDLDGDGADDLVVRGMFGWYGLPISPLADTTGSCRGALWCIAMSDLGYDAEVGDFDGDGLPDLSLAESNLEYGRVNILFDVGSRAGYLEPADIDMILVGIGTSTGRAMGSVHLPELDHDRLLIGEPGFDLGAPDIGGVFLLDLQRLR